MMRLSDSDLTISVLAVTHHKMEERENFPDFRSEPALADRQWSNVQDPAMDKYPTTPETESSNGKSQEPEAIPPLATADPAAGKSEALVETPEKETGFLPVLKNRNFLALWSGQVFSQLADKVYLVLTIALVASRFQAPDQTISRWVSAIMIAFTIPAVLFGAAAGVYVDRWSKKAVLVATNLLRGTFVLTLPVLLWLSDGWELGQLPLGFCLLLLVTFLVSTLTQFFAPAEQSVIPLIVERRHLLSANSLYTTTMMGSVIIGFAVGEPLLALADTLFSNLGGGLGIGKELVVGGSYAFAGVLLLSMKTGEKNDAEHEPATPPSRFARRPALHQASTESPQCFNSTNYSLFHFCSLGSSSGAAGRNSPRYESVAIWLFAGCGGRRYGWWGDDSRLSRPQIFSLPTEFNRIYRHGTCFDGPVCIYTAFVDLGAVHYPVGFICLIGGSADADYNSSRNPRRNAGKSLRAAKQCD
jgi:MFS family permease